MQLSLLNHLRQTNPVVLNISNFVTVQDVANGLNAIGASPIMSEEINETKEMVSISNAVALNLGAFSENQVKHIREMGLKANQMGKPVVLDPVAVGAIEYRLQVAQELLEEIDVAVIRGNAGEIAALAGVNWESKGIDAGQGQGDLVQIAQTAAQKFRTVILLSGEDDIITDGERVTIVHNGTLLFAAHVGSGDMLSSIVAAFCAVSLDNFYEASRVAALVFARIGELAVGGRKQMGPGTFTVNLLDQLQLAQLDQIKQNIKFEEE
ncbi:MAG TPA: hydroxyethylthiazole kinase [Ligilactobacillus acidipiscis]|uniref:Hydroxyethylthiazole kinase n=1 Tax=Ligilactobacillus acidipiscis TaxID=89059 RepID=A0A921FAK2_9LACO|nr:hydroxyethylthiazole kinase [Ligilactobacillus acidipiscis]